MGKNRTKIQPVAVPPSQVWDGNDGPWSTFNIHVGTPPVVCRVLASTVIGETWVVSDNITQGGCIERDSPDCPQSRGGLFNLTASASRKPRGIFALGAEENLPDYTLPFTNGDYGFDLLGVGNPGSGLTLQNQVVAGIANKNFYLGYLGLTSRPTNFTDFNDPKPSFLSSLKNQSHIPSLSFGYTAGNQYREKKVFGSLTLGGYDQSRFIPNDVSFQMAEDISRDLVVGLQSITYSDANHRDAILMADGVLAFVDSMVPHLWLPMSACTAFEKAFGLQYDSKVERYLVNDTLHENLLRQNASIAFTLGNGITGGSTVKISLPYKAFDLISGPPIITNASSNYFPLRRAANATQYTLGRTLLQEAYLIVDYERSNFSLSECLFDDNSPQKLVGIPAYNDPSLSNSGSGVSLSIGAIVGIVVAIAAIVTISGIGAFFFIKRRRRIRKEEMEKQQLAEEEAIEPRNLKVELGGIPRERTGELYGEYKPGYEMESKDLGEMEGKDSKLRAEMEGCKGGMEMDADAVKAQNAVPVEMWAGSHGIHEAPNPDERSRSSTTTLVPPFSAASQPTYFSRSGRPSPATTENVAQSDRLHPTRQLSARSTGQQSNVSSPSVNTSTRHESASELWDSRRSTGTPEHPERALSPQQISPASNGYRHRRGDDLTRRLEQVKHREDRSHPSVSSPSQSTASMNDAGRGSAQKDVDRFDRFNARFGSQPRSDGRPVDPSVPDPSSWDDGSPGLKPPPVAPKQASSPSLQPGSRRNRADSSQSRSRTRQPHQSSQENVRPHR